MYALVVVVVVLILLFGRNSGPTRPADAPETVLVLLVNRTGYSEEHVARVTENRKSYAEAHGTGWLVPLFGVGGKGRGGGRSEV